MHILKTHLDYRIPIYQVFCMEYFDNLWQTLAECVFIQNSAYRDMEEAILHNDR